MNESKVFCTSRKVCAVINASNLLLLSIWLSNRTLRRPELEGFERLFPKNMKFPKSATTMSVPRPPFV